MKMSKELVDKLRKALIDQDVLSPWELSAEVLEDIMENGAQSKIFTTKKNFLDEFVKELNKQLEEGNTVTAADIFEALGREQESAPHIKFEPSCKDSKPKKSTKPVYKIYEDLAYISAMEATRCHMLIDKLKASIDLLDAQQKYYEAMSMIERDNEMLGFDLSI